MGLLPPSSGETGGEHLGARRIQQRLGKAFDPGDPLSPPGEKSASIAAAGAPPAVAQKGSGAAPEPLPPAAQATTIRGPLGALRAETSPAIEAGTPPEPIPVAEPDTTDAIRSPMSGLGALIERFLSFASPSGGSGLEAVFASSMQLSPRVLTLSLIINLLGMALPLAILQIYDRILPNQSYETLGYLMAGLGIAFVLEACLKMFRSYLLGWHAVHHGFRSQVEAVDRLLMAPRGETGRHSPTVWLDALDALGEVSAFEGGQSRLALVDIPMAALFLVVIGLVGGPLVLVPVAVTAVFGFLTVQKSKMLQQALSNRSQQDNKQNDFLIECLSGIHTLKGLAIEPQILRRFERLQKTSALASYETIYFGNRLQSYGALFANLMMVSIVTCGALLVMHGYMSIGALACCSLLSGRLTQPVLRGVGMLTEIQNVELANARADKFSALTPAAQPGPVNTAISGLVAFDRVSFCHAGSDQPLLNGVSLTIRPGEFIGIRGEDGSGRSTLASLAMGVRQPQRGAVTIDGLPAARLRHHDLKHHLGYVSANSAIFKGTVLDNITLFRSGDAIDAAREAASLIGLEDDINHLPDGYDTMLGGAATLSAGLLQRIAIARALMLKPKILIFNEANSLMDFRSDLLLRAGLSSLKGSMTTILISNRPSLLNIADRVFELKGGSLRPYDAAPPQAASAPIESVA